MSLIYDTKTIKDVRYGDEPIDRVYCVWARHAVPTDEKLIIVCNLDLMVNQAFSINGLVYADSSYIENGEMHYVFNVTSKGVVFYTNQTLPIDSLAFVSMPKGMVRSFCNCFKDLRGLTSLDLSEFDTSKAVDLSNMFYSCSGLTSLDLSGFDTTFCTTFGNMFYSCSGLTSLDLSGFDTSKATNFSGLFRDCSGLTSLDVSNFDTSNGTNFTLMFANCSGLTSLDVSNFDTSNGTNFASMFGNCSGLTSLKIGPSFTTANGTNLYAMFSGCSGLTSLDLSGFDTSKATSINNVFASCFELRTIKLGPSAGKCPIACTLSFAWSPWGTGGSESLQSLKDSLCVNLYDRATGGLPIMTLQLHAQTKALLTPEEKAAITAKGYTIA